ncbi:MAG TPA: bifunctional UDP-N-acetylmuramoyl-tripeptide:D-alanyl-D-alanine ligase/alanine racemase [Chitinophagaceae bacterium]|nr:bifunctional UDP-N-acetylmuramoyl-tripeptide:D-alanyl-D-alanine ligase/alanine racemase [Chitinophagaceae bacterium]
MLEYSLSDIARIISAEAHLSTDECIEQLVIDSRRAFTPAGSLFFAIPGVRRDGHHFLPELYRRGFRNFVVSANVNTESFPDGNFLKVHDTIGALQALAAHHRSRFDVPVIGITGSNGKTIVKEWLFQLLHTRYQVVRSPKSYNSQVGVPLSVWQFGNQHQLGIFEAGISRRGEMERLQPVIRPQFGIFTHLGEAHAEGFASMEEKALEKIRLFTACRQIVYCRDHFAGLNLDFEKACREGAENPDIQFRSWSRESEAWLRVTSIQRGAGDIQIGAHCENRDVSIRIPFTDDASIENAVTCWCTLLALGIPQVDIEKGMTALFPVNMRLELKKAINHCSLINDSYSADLDSLDIALAFLEQQAGGQKKTVILSDFLQTGITPGELYEKILNTVRSHGITRLIGIGEQISSQLREHALRQESGISVELYPSTAAFIRKFRSSQFRDETILVKGARIFGFEEIVSLLEQKLHQTILEVNLGAMLHNLKQYQACLRDSTRVMAMVKAFAYGSGGSEIAGYLQFHKVDYLAVAYADEGVELRKSGITAPVMVMNPEQGSFEPIVSFRLEPELFSFGILKAFNEFLEGEGLQDYPVHVEIETGMNRLGFPPADIQVLGEYIAKSRMRVQSVFSHFAASEDAAQDRFTKQQFDTFESAAQQLRTGLGYDFLCHISNSAAIVRHPDFQLDMVRLGIGLYGIDPAGSRKLKLQPVATLRSTIAQLRRLKAGDTVSYGRSGKLERESLIATVRIGYADGYPRRLGEGRGKLWVRGSLVPTIGAVCMDMIMVDVTNVAGVTEGDEVILFGRELPIEQVAAWAGTIPYEIMTGVSQRVKRVFFEE